MKKFYVFAIFVSVSLSACSFTATETPTPIPPTPTLIPPTPVGYGIEFPFELDPVKEFGENVSITCEQTHDGRNSLDPDKVRKLVAAGGKLETTEDREFANLTYLWIGNVPIELFYEPEPEVDPIGIYYDVWLKSYCVSGLEGDVNFSGAYIFVITKIMPRQ